MEFNEMSFREELGEQILFFDGGMGTLLQERGLNTGEISETWNILHPEIIRQIHQEYLLAGSNMISANTFGVNAFKCKNLAYTVEELVTAGIGLVKEAIQEVREGDGIESNQPMYAHLDIGSLG